MTGKPYASPLTRTREFVQAVRGLVRGESVEQPEAEYFPITAGLPAVPCPPIRIGIGVLRPKMARLAGEIADEAVMWMCPPDYLHDVLVPAVKDGLAGSTCPPRTTRTRCGTRDTPSPAARTTYRRSRTPASSCTAHHVTSTTGSPGSPQPASMKWC
ncbi:LLM class flavin-dependent oxidoreductase [Streptomyces sp. CG4]|uniref:LLM class flavin-dependent oxidoreductase n=1 Tax=Streptomyces sp. CG4 TaxID=408783 RepID=UPI0034E2E4F3